MDSQDKRHLFKTLDRIGKGIEEQAHHTARIADLLERLAEGGGPARSAAAPRAPQPPLGPAVEPRGQVPAVPSWMLD